MKRVLLVVLIFIFLLMSCKGAASTLQVTNPQQPLEVDAGNEFTIILESNPTTGYHWDIMGELDSGMVEFVKSEYTSTSDPNLVGGGGLDIWTFEAINAGEIHITLGYYPPSNDPTDPQQTVTFAVIVK
jgi:inhibitor of cysteine peptidase